MVDEGAARLLVRDVPLLLENAQRGEHAVVGELGRPEGFGYISNGRTFEAPKHLHNAQFRFGEGR